MTKDQGKLIPNTFQHPNFYVDWLHYYLTPEEIVVLNKAVREILGWWDTISERKARIALSIFTDGKTSEEGNQLCLGCGLGIHALRKALAALDRYGILKKEGQPNQAGQMFYLQIDMEKVDWEGLRQRRSIWDEQNLKRTKKATKASMAARALTSDVGGNVRRYPNPLWSDPESTTTPGPDFDEGVTSDVRGGVTSDAGKETQGEIYKEGDKEDTLSFLWKTALTQLTYPALEGSRLIPSDNGTWCVELALAHSSKVDWVQNRIADKIVEALTRITGEERDLEVVARRKM